MRRYKEYCVIENVLVPKVTNSKGSSTSRTLVLYLSSDYLDRRLVEQVNRTLLIVRNSWLVTSDSSHFRKQNSEIGLYEVF